MKNFVCLKPLQTSNLWRRHALNTTLIQMLDVSHSHDNYFTLRELKIKKYDGSRLESYLFQLIVLRSNIRIFKRKPG